MPEGVDIRVLGPVEAAGPRGLVELHGGGQRTLIARLGLPPGRTVSREALIDALWADAVPPSATKTLQSHLARLRHQLRKAGLEDVIATRGSGYLLLAPVDAVDAARFEGLATRGRDALIAGDAKQATEALRAGLALWRGEALTDCRPGEWARAESVRLGEARLAAVEDLISARLVLGEYVTAIGELECLILQHPFRERLWELLILAFYQSGRQADALAAFARARTTLSEELGVDPGAGLRRLHEQILRADPAVGPVALDPAVDVRAETVQAPPELGTTEQEQGVDVARAVFPVCQLPPDVPDFTDRAEPLAILLRMLSETCPEQSPPTPVVVGAPGIGKSTLAVHAAHLVRQVFPDGQLYLDLAGTSDTPRDPAVMLAELLRALGVTGAAIPDSLHERAALYRSQLADRRVLLLLDDAASANQVCPLLPATGTCAVLVTSRRRLADLAGARHVDLAVFAPEEACQLLARIVGAERTAREPEQATAILRSCGFLPLAIRIVGAKLAGRQAWSLRVLKDRLEDESRRLSELRVGELGVRASFDLSLRLLPAEAARAFRLLGLLGAHTLPGWVIGPLLDRQHAEEVLDVLVDANLLQLIDTDPVGQPRYRLHDLLRAYAIKAAEQDSVQARRAAVTRVLAAWLALAEQARERIPPSVFQPTRGDSPRWSWEPDAARRLVADPLAWFDIERETLLGAVQLASDWGIDELAWELAVAAVPYYDHRSLYEDWQRSHRLALHAVRAADNLQGEAALLRGVGQVHIYRDDYDEAVHAMQRSLQLCRQTGDKRGEAIARSGLGTVQRVLGRYDQALDQAMQALDTLVAVGDRHTEAHLRNSIGSMRLARGHPQEARTWFDDALRIARDIGDRHREAHVLRELSQLHNKRDETTEALACLTRALTVFDELDDERCAAYTLLRIGRVYTRLGDRALASPVLERAAAVFRSNGDRSNEAECWQLLGELDTAHHDAVAARLHLGRALGLWRSLDANDQAMATWEMLHQVE